MANIEIDILKDLQNTACPAPCDCSICKDQYRAPPDPDEPYFDIIPCFNTYTSRVSDNDARLQVSTMIQTTEENLTLVENLCDTYGAAIPKKWKKIGTSKREEMLMGAEPELYRTRWGAIDCHYAKMNRIKRSKKTKSVKGKRQDPNQWYMDIIALPREHRLVHLIPWLSMDILSKDSDALLRLIYTRTQYRPQEWASFDMSQIMHDWKSGTLDLIYNRGCINMCKDKYGELCDWKAVGHDKSMIGFPMGILILEASSRISQLLRNVTTTIVATLQRPKAGLSAEGSLSGFSPLCQYTTSVESGVRFFERPFQVPPQNNITSLLSIAEARVDYARDHLALLQTDPAYLKCYSSQIYSGKAKPMFGEPKSIIKAEQEALELEQEIEYGQVPACCIIHDVASYWRWTNIEEEVQHTIRVSSASHDVNEYRIALGGLDVLLAHYIEQQRHHMLRYIMECPYFSKCLFVILPGGDLDCVGDTLELYRKDPLVWCMLEISIGTGGPQSYTWDCPLLYGKLDEVLSSDKKSLSSFAHMRGIFSELDALLQIREELKMLRPYLVEDPKVTAAMPKRKSWRCLAKGWGNVKKEIHSGAPIDAKSVFRSMRQVMKMPLPPAVKGQAYLDTDMNSRELMGKFWNDVTQWHRKEMIKLDIAEADIEEYLEAMRFGLDANHLAEVAATRQTVLDFMEATSEMPQTSQQPTKSYTPQSQWGTENTAAELPSKAKHKTRRQAVQSQSIANEANALDMSSLSLSIQQPTLKLRIVVKQHGFHTFGKIFVWGSKQSGSINKIAFIQATVCAGFSYTKSTRTGSSAVTFVCVNGEVISTTGRKQILLHLPHESEIEPHVVNAIRYRLKRTFGWDLDTFVLDDKKEK